jgi:hypothetical protein
MFVALRLPVEMSLTFFLLVFSHSDENRFLMRHVREIDALVIGTKEKVITSL